MNNAAILLGGIFSWALDISQSIWMRFHGHRIKHVLSSVRVMQTCNIQHHFRGGRLNGWRLLMYNSHPMSVLYNYDLNNVLLLIIYVFNGTLYVDSKAMHVLFRCSESGIWQWKVKTYISPCVLVVDSMQNWKAVGYNDGLPCCVIHS